MTIKEVVKTEDGVELSMSFELFHEIGDRIFRNDGDYEVTGISEVNSIRTAIVKKL